MVQFNPLSQPIDVDAKELGSNQSAPVVLESGIVATMVFQHNNLLLYRRRWCWLDVMPSAFDALS